MLVNKILKVVLVLLAGLFIALQGFAYEVEGTAVSAITLVLLSVLYCRWTKNKSMYFFWFMMLFTVGQLLSYYSYYAAEIGVDELDFYYYGVNILNIAAYTLLIIRILRGFDLKSVFSELSIPIFVLVVLDIFCVSIVSDTTENVFSVYQYALEFAYNSVIMVLLSVALLSYMYRNDNKSMLFLIGSICIVFSEIIQLAYYYILENNNDLGFIYSFFLVIGFLFFYLQSQIEFTGPEPEYVDEY